MSAVSARVLDEAIAWQLSLGSDEAGEREHREFERWLASHAEHRLVWQQLNDLDGQLAPIATPLLRRTLQRSAAELRSRRRRLAGSAFGLLLSVGLGLSLLAQQRPLNDYLADEWTAAGEQRELQLADHSHVRLNSRSALDIDYNPEQRRLFLHSGEILVETGHGDARPFYVDTPQGRLQALGTRFLVRREGDSTRLIVLQSAVAATPQDSSTREVVDAGHQRLMQRGQLSADSLAPLTADAWSRGMLVADQMPLGELIAHLGEYRRGYLGVDPSLANLPISGSFPLHDSDLALAALPASLPVRIERSSDWWVKVVPTTP